MRTPTKALQFSGGKDSLALLYLLKPIWDDLFVVWVNTGAAYPEVVAAMKEWDRMLPYFVEVNSDQPGCLRRHGYPADVVPLRYTSLGHIIFKNEEKLAVQSAFSCCAENIWQPLDRAMKVLGVTDVYRGQRRDETRVSPYVSGYQKDGITYHFPLEDWTEEQVYEFLAAQGVVHPAYWQRKSTSLDCWDCTAYLDESAERINSLPSDKKALIHDRLRRIDSLLKQENLIANVLGE